MTNQRPGVDFPSLLDRIVALRLEGLTYLKIAEETGTPLGTVSGVLTRARRSSEAKVQRESHQQKHAFKDDPRAKRPDYGRLPPRSETTVWRTSTSARLLEEAVE